MKVYIKNRVFSLGQGSSVVDENKNALFDVKGRAISITRKKFLYDANGQLLYSIRNKWINFLCTKRTSTMQAEAKLPPSKTSGSTSIRNIL